MRPSTIVLLVISLAGGAVSFAFWRELQAERALNDELSARLAAASVARPPPPPPPTPPPRAETVGAPPAAGEPSSPVADAPAPRPRFGNDYQRRLMSDPKYRAAWREQQRLQLAQRRDNYISILGFTPAQADAAIELAIDLQMGNFQRAGSRQSDQGEADARAYETKMRELLGPEKYARLDSYMESRQSRMQVDRFRSQLTGGDALRDDQVEPLIAAIHAEQSQLTEDLQEYRDNLSFDGDPRGTTQRYNERQVALTKDANERIHASASGILSSTQLAKLDTMLKRDLERLEAQQRMQLIRSRLDQRNSNDAPAGAN